MSRHLLSPLARQILAKTSASQPALARTFSAASVLSMRKALFSTSTEATESKFPTPEEAAENDWREKPRDALKRDLDNSAEHAKILYDNQLHLKEVLDKYKDFDHRERISVTHAALMRGSYIFGTAYISTSLALMFGSLAMIKCGLPLHELLNVELRHPADEVNSFYTAIETSVQLWKWKLFLTSGYTVFSMRRWIANNKPALSRQSSGQRDSADLQTGSA